MADTDRRGTKGPPTGKDRGPHQGRGPDKGAGQRRGPAAAGKGGPPGDRGRPRGKEGDAPEGEAPKPRIGAPRNEHGTRTARRVRCSRCGKVDHVPGGPREKDKVMCRACLEEIKALYEVGVREKKKMRPADCTVCGKHFELPVSIDVDDEEICCFDCTNNFTTWQGSVNKPETRTPNAGEERRPGVRLRKKTDADEG